ncbi:NIPSNAP family protein [Actinomadura sp.]|uniref:NIPSNAP family protein n=1 Tax=Actinomadura sp. TaxID=1989 RepID=UPI0037C82B26
MAAQQGTAAERPRLDDGLHSPIIEFRQYTLYPGTRDRFVELFDTELIEPQEAAGMRIIGQFRDLGNPNRFVWLRGFADMPARERALTAFYVDGPTWAEHGSTARSMMIDSSDSMLLRPARSDSGFTLQDARHRPPAGAEEPPGIVIATTYHFPAPTSADALRSQEETIERITRATGTGMLGAFVTEHSPNNFPRLPVREGENVLVVFSGFSDLEGYHEYLTGLGRDESWRTQIYPEIIRHLLMPPQILRLAPTSRSQLHG